MTRFRPCIDLHSGQVKQIIGSTLSEKTSDLQTNHVSQLPASHFASLYKARSLTGAHVIMLGSGNEAAAKEALGKWPKGLQVGGGINEANARQWIEWGAEKVIVTSCLFPEARFSLDRLKAVLAALEGDKSRMVIDLSCRKQDGSWIVAMDKWQTLTDMEVNQDSIRQLEPFCSEFLIHAADNEGLQCGIDERLVEKLGQWCTIPVTYAGGGKSVDDLERVRELSGGRVDLTIGSALDIFGGQGVRFDDCVSWNSKQAESSTPDNNSRLPSYGQSNMHTEITHIILSNASQIDTLEKCFSVEPETSTALPVIERYQEAPHYRQIGMGTCGINFEQTSMTSILKKAINPTSEAC